MSQDFSWNFDMALPSVEGVEDIDLELTDWESDSTYSETASDTAFIASHPDYIELASHDSSYSPSEIEYLSSSESSQDEITASPVCLSSHRESSAHILKSSLGLGNHGQITILDEREVEVDNGTANQFLISCWVDEEMMQKVLDLLHPSEANVIGV
jgi:hypothetical protein